MERTFTVQIECRADSFDEQPTSTTIEHVLECSTVREALEEALCPCEVSIRVAAQGDA